MTKAMRIRQPASAARHTGHDSLRSFMAAAVDMGIVAMETAAEAEASLLAACSNPGFAFRAAGLREAAEVAVVRSARPGSRGALLHALLVLDDAPAHRGDWLLGDAEGVRPWREVSHRWSGHGGSLSIEAAAPIPAGPDAILAEVVASRLPWLAGGTEEPPHVPTVADAVSDLVRIGGLAARFRGSELEARLIRSGHAGSAWDWPFEAALADFCACHAHLADPVEAFGVCREVVEDLVAHLAERGFASVAVRLAGQTLCHEGCDPRWDDVAEHGRIHYAVRVGGVVVDFTFRQFDPASAFPRVAKLDEIAAEWTLVHDWDLAVGWPLDGGDYAPYQVHPRPR